MTQLSTFVKTLPSVSRNCPRYTLVDLGAKDGKAFLEKSWNEALTIVGLKEQNE